MGNRGPTLLMPCLCLLLGGLLASFLMPAEMLFLAFRPTTRWDLALVWGGVLTAPLTALLVKALLPALARAHVSYVAALVACTCGAVVSTGGATVELPGRGGATTKVAIVRDPNNLFLVLIQTAAR